MTPFHLCLRAANPCVGTPAQVALIKSFDLGPVNNAIDFFGTSLLGAFLPTAPVGNGFDFPTNGKSAAELIGFDVGLPTISSSTSDGDDGGYARIDTSPLLSRNGLV